MSDKDGKYRFICEGIFLRRGIGVNSYTHDEEKRRIEKKGKEKRNFYSLVLIIKSMM